jgi:hypothetical protein
VNDFMTSFDGSKDLVPFPFDVRPVGMQYRLQSCFGQNPLTGCHVGGQRYAHTNWDDTQIKYHIHVGYSFTKIPLLSSRYSAALAMK